MSMIGHNNPPEISEIMAQEQTELYRDKLDEIERVLIKEASVPPDIDNDDAAGLASDFIKISKAVIKESDNIRLAEKKKFTVKSDAIQSFWKRRISPLEDAVKRVDERLAKFLKAKEDEKRRIAEEKARIAREEAEKKLREAEEAARLAREAEERERAEKERIQKEADERERKAKEDAERKRLEAEAEARRIKEESDRKLREAEAEAQRLRDQLAAQKAESDRKALLAEQEREAEEKLKREAKEAEEKLKQAQKETRAADKEATNLIRETEKEIRSDLREVQSEIKELQSDIKEIESERREAERAANRQFDEAVRADRDANKAMKGTLANSADFSRTRGDVSLSSLRERWIGEVADRDELFASAREIWDHIPMDALNQAVQSWVNANETNRMLRGALIYLEQKSAVR